MAMRTDVSSPIPNEFIQKQGQDQSHDANFALMELEKGLRSTKPGEQCEAIVRVPALVEKYPYPILVNSAFLKLADVFRGGSNFMKLCVLKAIQSSKRHLGKIFNVDEFCRRFFAVIHSNDPIARAVTLRVFGNISSIIADRKNIHHSIRNSLDSHDTMEVEAAIYATKCFAEQSRAFATGLFQKVADMIKALSTPIEMKLKLLPVFKFMYHDVDIVRQVTDLCKELLSSYPAHMFVWVILNTGTQLAVSTLLNCDEQINLLLTYLTDDPRKSIKLTAVKNLFALAKKAPHFWQGDDVDRLLTVALECLHNNIREKILQVVRVLALADESVNVFSQQILEKLEELSLDMCINISSLSLESRVHVTCAQNDTLDSETILTLESDVQMLFAISISENSLPSLKRCLSSAEKLLLKPSTEDSTLNDFLMECLSHLEAVKKRNKRMGSTFWATVPKLKESSSKSIYQWIGKGPTISTTGEYLLEVCHTLVTLCTYKRSLCSQYTSELISLFEKHIKSPDDKLKKDIMVAIFTLILQSSSKVSVDRKVEIQEELLKLITVLHTSEEFWTLYKMGRQSARLGYPLIASKTMYLLTTKVSSESFYFWLKALGSFEEGEAVLMYNVTSINKLQELLMSAHNHYQEGLTNLKAAVTTDHPLYFQFKFARLRSDMLRAYSMLLTCCASLRFNPPPSLARHTSLQTGQEVHHLSRLATQFQSCASMFSNVAVGFQSLYKSSFNCDQTSLQNIQLLQESCQLISYAIEALVLMRSNERVCPEFSSSVHNVPMNDHLQTLTDTNLEILRNVQTIDTESKDMPLSHRQINFLASIVTSHLHVGFHYPLYFYKSLQNTSLQLSISPGNAMPDNPYVVNVTNDMTLKIEGVIVEKGTAGRFRHTEKVNMMVKVKPSPNVRNVANEIKPVQPTEMVFTEIAKPHNDYFSAQFLLSFKYLGHHSIKIVTGINDENGIDWETGPSFVIHVEVQEHGHHKRR